VQIYEQAITGISTELSPNDSMFEGDRDHYFSVGQSALHCIRLAMFAAGKDDFTNILDFGCGYGRVLRVLRAAFPLAELTASDVSSDAIAFCARTFGADPVISAEDVSQIHLRRKFDLIWCGSLLTQFDGPQFFQYLEYFQSLLVKNGILVFTTHGPFVAQRLRASAFNYGLDPNVVTKALADYETLGIGYGDYPDYVLPRVGVSKYGISVTRPSWVCWQIERVRTLRILTYSEKAWDNHQDAVACINQYV
jgi:SAM-dependent methyltransferase